MELYMNAMTDFSIDDENGKKYTVEEAKAIVETIGVENCNMSFQRLMQFDFDLARLKRFYQEN